MGKRHSDILLLAALVLLGVMLILRQNEVSAAIIAAFESCVYRIVPSLFAMTVVSTAIANSGVLNEIFSRTRLNADILAAFIFGNIGGYPIGAKLLSEAVSEKRLTKETAEKALPFCFGAGPAFAAGVVGSVFGDRRVGICALCANIAANFTIYAIFCIFHGKNERSTAEKPAVSGFSTRLMTDSVSSAVASMISICSMIIAFSALNAVISAQFPSLSKLEYFPAILEISNIASLPAGNLNLVTASLLLGFGGICVNLQLFAVINGKFSLKPFYIIRAASLALSGIYAKIIAAALPVFGIATQTATKIRLSQSNSLIPIICVTAMVIITLRERSAISR